MTTARSIDSVGRDRARVTRDVELDDALDLLQRAPRACLSWNNEDGPIAEPVVVQWRDRRCLTRVAGTAGRLMHGQEVVLLVDEGVHWFDLRAVYLRGVARSVEPPPHSSPGHVWFEITVASGVAWDYGKLRRGEP
jgi:hypothetical protein